MPPRRTRTCTAKPSVDRERDDQQASQRQRRRGPAGRPAGASAGRVQPRRSATPARGSAPRPGRPGGSTQRAFLVHRPVARRSPDCQMELRTSSSPLQVGRTRCRLTRFGRVQVRPSHDGAAPGRGRSRCGRPSCCRSSDARPSCGRAQVVPLQRRAGPDGAVPGAAGPRGAGRGRLAPRSVAFQAAPKMSFSPVSSTPVSGSATCAVPRAASSEPVPVERRRRSGWRVVGVGASMAAFVDVELAGAPAERRRPGHRRRGAGEQLLDLVGGQRRALLQQQRGRAGDHGRGLRGAAAAEVAAGRVAGPAAGVVRRR